MILSSKCGNTDLLQHFWDAMQSEKTLSLKDIYDIIHNKDQNEVLGSTCLDYANQNKDEKTALMILNFENTVHMKDTLLCCIRESLKKDELKMWILKQAQKTEDGKSCCKEIGTMIEDYPKFAALGSIFIQLMVLSILPYSMDEVSDIRLYLTYSAKITENKTDQESLLSANVSFTREYNMHEYNIAKQITGLILLINCFVYIAGIFISNPTWITKHINEIERKEKRKKLLGDLKENGGLRKEYKKEYNKLLRESTSVQWKIFLIFSSVIARIFWPLFILIPHNFLNVTTQNRSYNSNDKYHTENLWMILKVVESSIENVTQLFLQIWLLLPYFRMISKWTSHELLIAAWNGSKNIVTFGYYQPKELDITIGKIFTTITLLSLSHAMQRIKKPGIGIGQTMKLLVIMFPATLLQVIARMYMVRNLILINVAGAMKYSLFLFVHFMALFIMKILFETRRNIKPVTNPKPYSLENIQSSSQRFRAFLRFHLLQNALDFIIKKSILILNGIIEAKSWIFFKIKRPILLIASCLSSTIVMVDLHWMSSRLHYPKFNFITTCLFHLLTLMENLAMTLLPFVAPFLFPSSSDFNHDSFLQAVIIVNISWIVAVLLEVII